MRHRKPHSIAEAVERLDVLLSEHAGRGRLPPVRVLCRQHGLSPMTVQRALGMLQQRGRCVVVPRGGVIPTGAKGEPLTPKAVATPSSEGIPVALRSWQSAKQRMSEGLFTGRFAAGHRLPSSKELRAMLGVGHVALRRALMQLARDGRLRREGRGWRVPGPGGSPAGSVLAFVGHGDTLSDLYEYTPRSAEYFRTMERLCQQRGLRMEFVSFRDAVLWRGRGPEFLAPESRYALVGTLVWTLGLYPQDIEALAARLLESGRRTALLDEGGRLIVPSKLLSSPMVQAFAMGISEMPGLATGRYLVNRGHRRVVFFTYGTDDSVFENRARGLRRALDDTMADVGLHMVHLSELAGDEMWDELARRSAPAVQFSATVAGAERLLTVAQSNPHRRRFTLEARALAQAESVRELLAPRLREVRALAGVTAWVAGNDSLAFVLLDFLRDARIDVPGAVSVVGFDDTPGAFTSGLTSYNFNAGLVAQRMLEHVLSPAAGRPGRKPDWVEVPGFVVERATSGVARHHG